MSCSGTPLEGIRMKGSSVPHKQTRVLVLMSIWHAPFETRFFNLVRLLREKGCVVDFCVATQKMNKSGELYIPAIPRERLELPHFREIAAVPVESLKDLRRRALNADIIVTGLGKGMDRVFSIFESISVPLVYINDIADGFMRGKPDVLALSSDFYREVFERYNIRFGELRIIGDLRYDGAADPLCEDEKQKFYAAYRLDPAKPFVVFATGATQRIQSWMADLYKGIVSRVEECGFGLVLRLHPNDIAGHKKEKTLGDVSSRVLYPHLPVLAQGDLMTAMKLCACMVSVESSTCLETSLFKKNAVVVNYHEWCLTDQERARDIFSRKRFNGFGIQKGIPDPRPGSGGIHRIYFMHDTEKDAPGIKFIGILRGCSWLGADCHLDELGTVLKDPRLFTVDEKLCREHSMFYWYKNDGKAAQRAADIIIELAARKGPFGLRMPYALRFFCSAVYLAGCAVLHKVERVRERLRRK